METVDDVLAHFGVKGMHWGVRKAARAMPGSEDSQRAVAAKEKIKTGGGTKALSNKELQDLVTRMNLEQQYKKLTPPPKSQAAKKFVVDVLVNVGKQQVTRLASDVATKQVAEMMKKAGK